MGNFWIWGWKLIIGNLIMGGGVDFFGNWYFWFWGLVCRDIWMGMLNFLDEWSDFCYKWILFGFNFYGFILVMVILS